MKQTFFFFFLFLFANSSLAQKANRCNTYDCAIRAAEAQLKTKNIDYQAALNHLDDAEDFAGNEVAKKQIIRALRKKVFVAIENEKKKAIEATKEAKKQEQLAKDATIEAKKQTEIAEAVLDKIYFYDDKFGLAYDKTKGKYGFIDKNLKTKIAFKYEEALPFDNDGWAKVKKDGVYYLIDTIGTEYKLATDINQLKEDITALDLIDKNLREIPFSVFQHTQLKVLLLKGNELKKIPEDMKALSNLLYFDISSNKITTLEGLDNLKALQNFDISYNQITTLEGLDNLKALQNFEIGGNQITKLEGLDNLKALQHFNIGGNQITKLEGLDNLKNIKTFSIGGNPLSLDEINQKLSAMPKLEELGLRDLGLTKLPEAVLTLKQLKKLSLDNYGEDNQNIFSAEEQARIKQLLPNCEIVFPR